MSSEYSHGACLTMKIQRGNFNQSFVEALVDHIMELEGPHMNPFQRKGWETSPAWREEMAQNVASESRRAPFSATWDLTGDLAPSTHMKCLYTIDATNPLEYPGDDVWLQMYMFHGNLDVTHVERVTRLTERYRSIVNFVKPRYAFVDHIQDNMKKRKGEDPRQFAWGSVYLEAIQVETIGADIIEGCSAEVKIPLENGLWFQPTCNPWVVDWRLKVKIASELQLKRLLS
jgi:hypothetical protein